MNDGQFLELLLLVGTLFAAVYGIFAALELRRAARAPRWARPAGATPGSPGADTPRFVSRGDVFERNWQGSLGYQRPPDPQESENRADRLFVSTFFSLRPSRFRERYYWRSYLLGVWLLRFIILFGLPLLALVLIGSPSTPASSSFTPTSAQRNALRTGTPAAEPSVCPRGQAVRLDSTTDFGSSSPTAISANDDGAVYTIPPGTHVVVSSYAGYAPRFAASTPLCPAVLPAASGRPEPDGFVATTPGTGYVYFPEPGGSAFVARIDVVGSPWHSPLPLAVLALAVVATDVVLRLRLRKVQDRG